MKTNAVRKIMGKTAIGLGFAACLAAGAMGWQMSKTLRFRYNPYQQHPSRPHPTEMLLEVKRVRNIDETSAGPKSASIIKHEYKKQLDAMNIDTAKAVSVQLTLNDYDALGKFEVGDRIALFGWEADDGTAFRIEKYEGSAQNAAAQREWMKALK